MRKSKENRKQNQSEEHNQKREAAVIIAHSAQLWEMDWNLTLRIKLDKKKKNKVF